jgi:hypothetical protein
MQALLRLNRPPLPSKLRSITYWGIKTMFRFASIVAGFILAVLAIAPASANTIQTYELNGVTFKGGGTATGTFTLDLTTNTLVSSDITTSFKNIVFVGGDYNGSIFDSLTTVPSGQLRLADWGIPLVTGQLFSLSFTLADLSMASFVAHGSETVYSAACFITGFVCGSREIVAGTINAVATTPIPAALPLLMTALGGMGFMGWRRKRQNEAA